MSTKYDLYHNTYISAKTKGVYIMQEPKEGAKWVLQEITVWATTCKSRCCVQEDVTLHPPHPKEFVEELMYTIDLAYEIRMDFYNGVLKTLCVKGDTVFNVFSGTKFVYATLVNISPLASHKVYGRTSVNYTYSFFLF